MSTELDEILAKESFEEGIQKKIASILKWNESDIQFDFKALDKIKLKSVIKTYISNQPAVIFAYDDSSKEEKSIQNAALFAYHNSVEWGLLIRPTNICVFNSHWIKDGRWYHLPIKKDTDFIKYFSPKNILQGKLEKNASKLKEPDRLLLPVDDALVERLGYWRKEALGYSSFSEKFDEKLQTLFAQLFVLRSVEDRNLSQNVPPIESKINEYGEIQKEDIAGIFQLARNEIQSELFKYDSYSDIPDDIISGIVKDLYEPSHLPLTKAKYNFAWLDSDVLGYAYEKYLSNVLTPSSSTASQLNIFGRAKKGVDEVSIRKAEGVYYTPSFLVSYLTNRSMEKYFSERKNVNDIPRIIDFSCGSGSFLVAAIKVLIKKLQGDSVESKNWIKEIVEQRKIIGIDNDKRAVILARLSLWLKIAEEPDPLPLPQLEEIIIQGDSLNNEVWSQLPEGYDIVLGNPPFKATGTLTSNREELEKRFKSAKGRFDYSYLFVELALNILNEKGILGMVIPNRLFKNRDASFIRKLITDHTKIISILDFHSNEVFQGTNAYIGTIILENTYVDRNKFRFTDIKNLPNRFLTNLLLTAEGTNKEYKSDYLHSYFTSQPKGDIPWLFLSPNDRKYKTLLQEKSEPLSSIASIYQGIRTGANDLFIINIESSTGSLTQVSNSFGEVHLIETSLLKPMIYGSDINRYEVVSPSNYLIYPYLNANVIDEEILKEDYPETYNYFQYYSDILNNRASIKSSGLNWYEIVRRRDESWLESKKLIIRDLSTQTEFALDMSGLTYLVGGTAVVPHEENLLVPLAAYLNSKIVDWYLDQITPSFRAGYRKVEPNHLKRLPVPITIFEDYEFTLTITELVGQLIEAKQIGKYKIEEEINYKIDDLLASKIGLRVDYL